jgi:hypothetical protein
LSSLVDASDYGGHERPEGGEGGEGGAGGRGGGGEEVVVADELDSEVLERGRGEWRSGRSR